MIDDAVVSHAPHQPELVIALGGGSVLDAGKAIAAMLPLREPVKLYLEGIGTKNHPGLTVPLVALPTTSGTGSEATRNAVLSEVGSEGFKRSLRHMNFVPHAAILDPQFTITCPPAVTAYSGMDAFTQLLESYLSTASNPFTHALSLQGLRLIASSLLPAFADGSNEEARIDMSLAAYFSGVCLANAGLGTVHGLAGVIGGKKNIAHGIICSALMWPANAIAVKRLRASGDKAWALSRYADAGRIFSAEVNRSDNFYIDAFIDLLYQWTQILGIPRLQQYGIGDADITLFARLSDDKNNPVAFSADDRCEILSMA